MGTFALDDEDDNDDDDDDDDDDDVEASCKISCFALRHQKLNASLFNRTAVLWAQRVEGLQAA